MFFLLDTYSPFENDGSVIDGFVVGDVRSINRAFMSSPSHHCVRLRRGTGRTGTDHIHRHHTKFIGCTYMEREVVTNRPLGRMTLYLVCLLMMFGFILLYVFLFRANEMLIAIQLWF